ncbi:MAG: winged helix-turn-helix domain-containing protein, partial [Kiritimatiellae bacterium]|nr:winged helix-turn-helix domain-containing protein [Kiritimatiellia bacterium]
LICSEKPDLVVLDLMLPGMDGLEVCRRVKQDVAVRHIPLVMASAKGEESDVVVGLELGADDYLTKPFSPKVLVARIKTVLRRKAREVLNEECVLVREELTLDPVRMLVKVSDVSVDLTATEYRVLHFLARRPGWVFTRQQIVDSVKGEDYPVTERSVDVQLVGLRKKLGSAADMIETVRGIGYRFRE